MNKSKWIALVFMGLSVAACGGDEPDTNPPGTTPDDMPVDVVDEMPDEPDTRPDMTDTPPDMCTPRTSCDDVCGSVDDGCGGMLECSPCECVNGMPAEPTCGQCGLGTASCDAQGVGSCSAPPAIPGLEGLDADACAAALLYVAVSSGSASEDGSRAAPYKSLDAALAAAATKPEVKALLINGSNEYFAPTGLELREGVSLIGGWDATWQYAPVDEQPTILGAGRFDNGDLFGARARNVASPTLLHRLLIRSSDNDRPSASTYGLHAVQSSGLILDQVRIVAGAGGSGVAGEAGASGDAGLPGAAGRPHIMTQGLNGFAGAPGEPVGAGQSASGRGGFGRNAPLFGMSAEQPGQTSPGGAQGGMAGTVGVPSGRAGAPGMVLGPQATQGTGGLSQGVVEDELWVQQGDGGDGAQGPQGGGGGGGGGAYSSGTPCRLDDPTYCPGPSGGSGGSGGGGGGGGQGGGGGGASFGLFAVASNLTVRASYLGGGIGGAGGDGGQAGVGGRGGDGGRGADSYTNPPGPLPPRAPTLYKGGDGGRGADGLPGGHGGGGAGGPSYGAYCENSRLTLAETTLIGGGTANPGQSLSLPGQAGLSIDEHSCR